MDEEKLTFEELCRLKDAVRQAVRIMDRESWDTSMDGHPSSQRLKAEHELRIDQMAALEEKLLRAVGVTLVVRPAAIVV